MLRFKDKLHLITGFSVGAIIGVAFFDLLPEAVVLKNETQGISQVSLLIDIGFIVYMILERMIVLHSHQESGCENTRHRGILGAGSLSLHSFLDGVSIGLAFQISNSVGTIVTVAVLTRFFQWHQYGNDDPTKWWRTQTSIVVACCRCTRSGSRGLQYILLFNPKGSIRYRP